MIKIHPKITAVNDDYQSNCDEHPYNQGVVYLILFIEFWFDNF